MKGRFITFEGIEGCGKSTQVERVKRYLETGGHRVEVMREPGGTVISEAIREILLDPANGMMSSTTELLLYEAARSQLVAERIGPALERGAIVLCDRFFDSTSAYQGGGRGFEDRLLEELHLLATGGLAPDLTIFIDVPVETGLSRATKDRPLDRIEQESGAFHESVRGAFLRLAADNPERIKTVDGALAPEAVEAEIRKHLKIDTAEETS